MGSARYSDRATAADRYPPITAHPGDVALSSQRRRPNPVGHNQIVEVRESQGVHDRSVALVYRLILYVRRCDISWKERRIGRAVTEYPRSKLPRAHNPDAVMYNAAGGAVVGKAPLFSGHRRRSQEPEINTPHLDLHRVRNEYRREFWERSLQVSIQCQPIRHGCGR